MRFFPRAGRRRHQLDRFITCTTDTAIKAGSRKDKCGHCDYTSSKKRMHRHYRQHLNKHFSGCGYNSASHNSIYQHQHYGHCREPSNIIYKGDRQCYARFLRHVKWTLAQPFGECIPALDGEGRCKLTYQIPEERRRPVRERLGEPVAVRRMQTVPPAVRDALERLE